MGCCAIIAGGVEGEEKDQEKEEKASLFGFEVTSTDTFCRHMKSMYSFMSFSPTQDCDAPKQT